MARSSTRPRGRGRPEADRNALASLCRTIHGRRDEPAAEERTPCPRVAAIRTSPTSTKSHRTRFHFHSAFEEAIYVLEGTATLRIGKERVELRAGDYVAIPAGPDGAHALTNTGAAALRYLCMSGPATPTTMDIVGYPDSKKIAFASGVDPGRCRGLADATASSR